MLPFAILNARHMWGNPMLLILFKLSRHIKMELFLVINHENSYLKLPKRNYYYGLRESDVGVGDFHCH